MKQFGQLIVISLIAIIFVPTAITLLLGNNKLSTYTPITQGEYESKEDEQMLEDKIIGIVIKAMPINYEEEALKAQSIIARSHIVLAQQTSDQQELPSSMTIEEIKELWGNDFNRNYGKIRKIVEETDDLIVTYKDEPIQLVYHLQSAGETQNALDIWGVDVPYLENIESIGDQKASDLINQKTYNVEEIVRKVNQHFKTQVLEAYNIETQIQIIERTQAGYVKSIQVGNQLMLGDDFRKIAGLLSNCFSLQYKRDEIIVTTKGIGHGVGLSQYGANEMAKEGKNYEEILKHYFPQTTIEPLYKNKNFNK